jgi:hypothetical protein
MGAWTGLIWLSKGTGNGYFGFYTTWVISGLAKNQLAAQSGLRSVE